MIRTTAAVAALVTAALLGAPLAAHAGIVDSTSMKDPRGDVEGNKKMRAGKSIDLTRVTYKHVEADGEELLVAQYEMRNAFGRDGRTFQAYATQSEGFVFQSHFRPNGTVEVWSDEAEELVTCEGATETIDRRRDRVTQRVPVSCLGSATEGELAAVAVVVRGDKVAIDFSRFRQFSWGSSTVIE